MSNLKSIFSDETFRDIEIPADILSAGSISPFDHRTKQQKSTQQKSTQQKSTQQKSCKNKIFSNDINQMESNNFFASNLPTSANCSSNDL